MQINDDGIKLNAILEKPENFKGKCPLVIIIHGVTGNCEETHIVAVSKMFNELGLATLRVDMYGHGKSEGRFRDHTLYKWVNNALTVIDYAEKLDFVTDLYLCGHSQGGLTVILAAALKHDKIKGLIAMSPATMIPKDARKGDVLRMTFDPDAIPDEVPNSTGDRVLGSNYFRVAQAIYVEQSIDKYTGPVFLIHGDEDESVPLKCSTDAAKRYKNAELVIIPGETHCYNNHLDQVVEEVRKWMVKQMG